MCYALAPSICMWVCTIQSWVPICAMMNAQNHTSWATTQAVGHPVTLTPCTSTHKRGGSISRCYWMPTYFAWESTYCMWAYTYCGWLSNMRPSSCVIARQTLSSLGCPRNLTLDYGHPRQAIWASKASYMGAQEKFGASCVLLAVHNYQWAPMQCDMGAYVMRCAHPSMATQRDTM